MDGAERRARRRRACDLKVEVRVPDAGGGRSVGEGTLINISLDGGLLAFPGPLYQGLPYVLRLTEPAAAVLPCLVLRDAGAFDADSAQRYFGLAFVLSPEQEDAFAAALALLGESER